MLGQGEFLFEGTKFGYVQDASPEMEEIFSTFEIEHAQRSENWYADVLAVLGLQITFEGSSTKVEVNKWRESIVEILQERFQKNKGVKRTGEFPLRKPY